MLLKILFVTLLLLSNSFSVVDYSDMMKKGNENYTNYYLNDNISYTYQSKEKEHMSISDKYDSYKSKYESKYESYKKKYKEIKKIYKKVF